MDFIQKRARNQIRRVGMTMTIPKGTNAKIITKNMGVEQIVQNLEQWADAYYNSSEPIVSDEIYDIFEARLRELDPENQFLKKIGSHPKEGKCQLPFYMPSLDKIKTEKEIAKFLEKNSEKNRKYLVAQEYEEVPLDGSFVVSEKLDGVSVALVEKDGELKMYTRGESKIGQDISSMIPLINVERNLAPRVQIRGELVIKKKVFEEKFSNDFANARNLVSGVVNSKEKDPTICASIDFLAYEVVHPYTTPYNQFLYLKNLRFQTPFWKKTDFSGETNVRRNLEELLAERKEKSEYEIDGLVITGNFLWNRVKNGNPKYSVAYKSESLNERGVAVVDHVEWNVSKNSSLKPVVIFKEPVNLEGVSISKVTGINARFISENDIGKDAVLEIIRSGGVIPKIVDVLKPTEADMPGPEVPCQWDSNEVELKIHKLEEASEDTQKEIQNEIVLKNLQYFFEILGVENLGPGILKKLIENGYDSFEKIIELETEDLLKIEGFQEVLAQKIVQNIQSVVSNGIEFWKIIAGFKLFGENYAEKKIQLVLDANQNVKSLEDFDRDQLVRPVGISWSSMDDVRDGLEKFFKEIQPKLSEKIKIIYEEKKMEPIKGSLIGQQYVFTKIRDKELEEKIKSYGGEIGSGISKRTTVLVVKNYSVKTNKTQKAEEAGIKVIDIETLREEIDKL
jgi:NAD-dependent DNA ligase